MRATYSGIVATRHVGGCGRSLEGTACWACPSEEGCRVGARTDMQIGGRDGDALRARRLRFEMQGGGVTGWRLELQAQSAAAPEKLGASSVRCLASSAGSNLGPAQPRSWPVACVAPTDWPVVTTGSTAYLSSRSLYRATSQTYHLHHNHGGQTSTSIISSPHLYGWLACPRSSSHFRDPRHAA